MDLGLTRQTPRLPPNTAPTVHTVTRSEDEVSRTATEGPCHRGVGGETSAGIGVDGVGGELMCVSVTWPLLSFPSPSFSVGCWAEAWAARLRIWGEVGRERLRLRKPRTPPSPPPPTSSPTAKTAAHGTHPNPRRLPPYPEGQTSQHRRRERQHRRGDLGQCRVESVRLLWR